jgi:pimeloyl-ACP methyl ester carboxylesterase
MSRWIKRTLIAFGGLVVVAATAGATYEWIATGRDLARTPPPGRLVDVGGHRLHIWCSGSGTPSVILETGLGGSSADWGFVQPPVAKFTRVCSYDRAGMGYSDPGPSPRTTRQITRELSQLLDRTGITDPVVLVGASIGGLAVRLLASEHPERVAGLVLVDASHEDQDGEVPRIAPFVPLLSSLGIFRLLGVTFGPPPAAQAPAVRGFAEATGYRAAAYQAAVDEFTHLRQSAGEVKATRRQLNVPVVVVTAGRGTDAAWLELQRDQVALSQRGCQIIAENSGHAVAHCQPEIVIRAVQSVVDAVNGRNDASLCAEPSKEARPSNNELQRTRPAQAMEPRR